MEPFDPVAIRIGEPALPSHSKGAISTNLLLACCGPKRPYQRRYSLQNLLRDAAATREGLRKPSITKLLKDLDWDRFVVI